MANETQVRKSSEVAPRWPLSAMARMEQEMDRLFAPFRARWWPGGLEAYAAPMVDVYEDKDDIVVKAELPGMSKDDIEVNVTDHQLTLKGEKKKEAKARMESLKQHMESLLTKIGVYTHEERLYGFKEAGNEF